jgi:hypothetical protein
MKPKVLLRMIKNCFFQLRRYFLGYGFHCVIVINLQTLESDVILGLSIHSAEGENQRSPGFEVENCRSPEG